MDQEIKNLLQAGLINQCTREDLICILPTKCVPKSSKKWRLVIDSRKFNNYIKCDKFTQEGIESVSKQIWEGDQLILIDLKNGFHHVKVQKWFRKYLGITWKGKYYCWWKLSVSLIVAASIVLMHCKVMLATTDFTLDCPHNTYVITNVKITVKIPVANIMTYIT